MTRRYEKPMPVDWRDLMGQERKALTFRDLPPNIKAIFTKKRAQKHPGG